MSRAKTDSLKPTPNCDELEYNLYVYMIVELRKAVFKKVEYRCNTPTFLNNDVKNKKDFDVLMFHVMKNFQSLENHHLASIYKELSYLLRATAIWRFWEKTFQIFFFIKLKSIRVGFCTVHIELFTVATYGSNEPKNIFSYFEIREPSECGSFCKTVWAQLELHGW